MMSKWLPTSFCHKIFILSVLFTYFSPNPLYAQEPFSNKYIQLKWAADSLYRAKDYKQAKTVYLKILKCRHYQRNDLYYLFHCCEILHQKDSARHYFSMALNVGFGWYSISTAYKDEYISDFLNTDSTLLSKLKKNVHILNYGDTTYSQLRKQLSDRYVTDQRYRTEVDTYQFHPKTNQRKIDSLWKLQNKADSDNVAFLKTIIYSIGWPDIDKVGVDGDNAAWLIVQHDDKDVKFQEFCLTLIVKEMAKHNTIVTNYPYLKDRILLNKGGLQIFGTQFQSDFNYTTNKETELTLRPMKTTKDIDKLRNAYAMSSLEGYKNRSLDQHIEK